MTYLEKLINKYCPNGYEWKELKDITKIYVGGDLPKKSFSETKNENFNVKILTNGSFENNIKGYTNSYVVPGNSITISARGTIGYCEYQNEPFYPIIRLLAIHPTWHNSKFIYYFLKNLNISPSSKSGIPQLTRKHIENIKIPLIPLKIQEKIVEILERFRILEAELKAELKAELEARGKQFDFTLAKIFNFKQFKLKKLWEITFWDKKFQEVEKFKQNKISNFKYLFYKEIENYNDPQGDVKIITTGKEENLKINSKNYEKDIYSGEILLIPGGGEANIKYHKGKFVTGDNRIGQVLNKNEVETKFLYYYFLLNLDLIRKNFRGGSIKHPYMKNILELNIPIPSLEVQNKIVSILDKLSEYSQEINSGLPAEIELRSKQFKYYRDQLLNFKNNE